MDYGNGWSPLGYLVGDGLYTDGESVCLDIQDRGPKCALQSRACGNLTVSASKYLVIVENLVRAHCSANNLKGIDTLIRLVYKSYSITNVPTYVPPFTL